MARYPPTQTSYYWIWSLQGKGINQQGLGPWGEYEQICHRPTGVLLAWSLVIRGQGENAAHPPIQGPSYNCGHLLSGGRVKTLPTRPFKAPLTTVVICYQGAGWKRCPPAHSRPLLQHWPLVIRGQGENAAHPPIQGPSYNSGHLLSGGRVKTLPTRPFKAPLTTVVICYQGAGWKRCPPAHSRPLLQQWSFVIRGQGENAAHPPIQGPSYNCPAEVDWEEISSDLNRKQLIIIIVFGWFFSGTLMVICQSTLVLHGVLIVCNLN